MENKRGMNKIKQKKREKLIVSLRNKYTISIVLLALLVLLNQMMVQHLINVQQHNAELINVAGKQRMYSQKIAKAALGVDQALTGAEQRAYRIELWSSLQSWEQNHQLLRSDYGRVQSLFTTESRIPELYEEADPYLMAIFHAGKRTLALIDKPVANEEELLRQLRIIRANEPDYLRIMEEIVQAHEEEAKNVIKKTQEVEQWILVISLSTLLLVSVFVFGPALRELGMRMQGLKEARDNLTKLFLTAPNPMMLIRKENKDILLINRLARELFGITSKEEGVSVLRGLQMVGKESESLESLLVRENVLEGIEVVVDQAENERRFLQLSSRSILYRNEEAFILGFVDVTRLKEAEAVLLKDAATDHMTGLLNKHYGLQRLNEMLEQSRSKGTPLAICFMDIDFLKLVNDRYGHEEGDAYIEKMADLLIRNTGMKDVVFRYGGDEMVAIFDNCDRPCAEKILKRLEASVHHLAEASEKPYPVHASFGLALSTEKPEADAEKLLSIADQAMYESKKRYKESLGENAPELR